MAERAIAGNRLVSLGISARRLAGCVLCFFRLRVSGIAIRAIIQQRDAAALVGIDVDRINVQVFALGFALAGACRRADQHDARVSPFMGFPFTVSAFVIIILGGLGNPRRSHVRRLVLAVVEVYGVALTSPSYRSILVYGVFIAVLLRAAAGPVRARPSMATHCHPSVTMAA